MDASAAQILIVEDDEVIMGTLTYNLSRGGYGVKGAATGAEALRLARTMRPDLILLDIMLPGCNGYRVCAELRRAGDRTPILMLTAKDGELDEAEALDTGADDYLTKPFAFVVLLARLRALIRRGLPERPTVLEAGDLRFDPATRRVQRGDVAVEMTSRETALLEFLLRRPGHVLSKQTILDHVWDADFEGDPNIVEVYVSALRRKIDAPFGRSSLVTVRGAGYRLRPDGGRL